jgi:LacI family transcriptional regulator
MGDVAKLAGCSQSTVSLVLNEIPNVRIAEETRRRVREAARSIGYQVPWAHARPMGAMREIGFVVDRLATSPEAVVSIDGAHEAARQDDHLLLIATTLSDPEIERATLASLLSRPIDGLIYASIMTRRIEPPELPRSVPTVLLNCYTEDRALPSVIPGEIAGGQAATTHLARAGHRRIAIVTGEMWMEAAQDRLRGYRRALATADVPFDPELVREGNWEYGSGYEAARALTSLPDPPTAIFFANDRMAVGGYARLREQGLRIPQDISVIGYDDQAICQELSPPLTTMVLPHREMGQWAVEWLLHEAQRPHGGRHSETERPHQGRFPVVKLDCPLVDRDSVGPPRSRE